MCWTRTYGGEVGVRWCGSGVTTRGMMKYLDRFIRWLKWPMALAVAAATPAAAQAFWREGSALMGASELGPPLATGAVAYWLAWLLFFRRRGWGSAVSTLEHELTHAIFALATLHRVHQLRMSWGSGGHVKISRELDWPILVAPYFFPTVAVAWALTLAAVSGHDGGLGGGILGVSLAYQLTSTWRETHRGQSDLRRVGFGFAALFLPGANLLSHGAVLAFYRAGILGLASFAAAVWSGSEEFARALGALF